MNFYKRLTTDRYNYTNSNSSLKFIDFMNTDMDNSSIEDEFDKCDTIDEDLARIIRSVFSYCKYEPYNPYVFHKVVPSARNIHPNEAFLINDGNIRRFNSKANAFELIGHAEKLKGKIWVVIASELWRIMKFYGEFGLALSLLDAGHILAELKMKLVNAGYDKAKLVQGVSTREICEYIGFSEDSACISYYIDLSDYLETVPEEENADDVKRENLKHKNLKHENVKQEDIYHESVIKKPIRKLVLKPDPWARRKFQYDDEINFYTDVTNFLHKQERRMEELIAFADAAKELNSVLNYEINRSSGHSTPGLFSILDRLPEELIRKYALGAASYIKNYLGDEQLFRVCFLYRSTDGENYLLSASGKGITKPECLEEIHRDHLLHDSFEHINMKSIPLNVLILYTTTDEYSEETNIYKSHIGAGEISQYVSLIAAGDGFFARPMKNFNDRNLAKLLNCNEEKESILYSTVIGKENHYSYILYL